MPNSWCKTYNDTKRKVCTIMQTFLCIEGLSAQILYEQKD
jgi:hypothetical protein